MKYICFVVVDYIFGSRPARALWIEILCRFTHFHKTFVEAREGLVD